MFGLPPAPKQKIPWWVWIIILILSPMIFSGIGMPDFIGMTPVWMAVEYRGSALIDDPESRPFSGHGKTGVSGPCGIPYTHGIPAVSSPLPSSCPVTGGSITQCPNGSYSHSGVQAFDFGIGQNAPINSTMTGYVFFMSNDSPTGTAGIGGCANQVQVVSTSGSTIFSTIYGHMVQDSMPDGVVAAYEAFQNCVATVPGCAQGSTEICNCDGALINVGDLLGGVDTTGNSTGDHLHYELRGDGDIQIPTDGSCAGYLGPASCPSN
jgi:hypothetical protein